MSHLRLPQPGGPGSRIYIPQEQGGPVIHPGTGLCCWMDVDIVIYGVMSRYSCLEYEFLEVVRLYIYPSIFNCHFFLLVPATGTKIKRIIFNLKN
jgi:hypothetical protein